MKNRLTSVKHLLACLFLITLLFIGLLSFLPVTMPTAEAVNNPDGACRQLISQSLIKQGENVPPSEVPTEFYEKCVEGYKAGYKTPNNNDTSKACPTSQSTTRWYQYCVDGYRQGQKDKKAESGAAPSAGQIKQAAEKACQPYKDQKGLSQSDRDRNFEGCVAGYTGQKGTPPKDSNDACKSFSGPANSACLEGYNNAASGEKVDPGSGASVTPGGVEPGAASDTGEDDRQLDCDTQFENPLTWIICPVIDILAGTVDVLDNMITKQMTVETDDIFGGGGTSDAYYKAWQSFRNIALGLVAIAGLIVLISQALGFEILDAYTIRKVLPRVLVAVVAITLSWQLMKLGVEFTNDLGFGVRRLIYAPFNQLSGDVDLDIVSNDGFNAVFGTGSALLVGGGTVIGSIVFIGVLLSYAATAALAVFIAVLVLVLRQVLIIMLLLMAPIAIITYVLPNTQRIYKFWWESFSKALLMFPLIAAFIAAGRVFSAISLNSGGLLNQMVGFAAYFAPYFLIPATFKLAGGALRQIGGFVNDRSRGGFDRLRNYRGNQMKQAGQDFASGQALRRLGPGRPGGIRDRINKGLQKPTLIGAAGYNPANWRRNMSEEAQRRTGAKRSSIDNEEEMVQIAGYDDLQRASTEGMGNDARMRQWLARRTRLDENGKTVSKYSEDMINEMLGAYSVATRGLRSKGYSNEAILQGVELSGMKAKTAYMDEEDYDEEGRYIGNANALENIVRLSGGNTNTIAQMVGKGVEQTSASGRKDIIGSFSETLAGAGEIRKASVGPDGLKDTKRGEIARKLSRNVINKEGIGAIVGGNAHATQHLLMDLEDQVKETYNPNLPPAQQSQEAKHALATLGYLEEVNGTLPPEKQAMVAKLLSKSLGTRTAWVDGKQVTTNITRQSILGEMTMDEEYNRYKSEYYYKQIRAGGNPSATEAHAAEHRPPGPAGPVAPPPVPPPAG